MIGNTIVYNNEIKKINTYEYNLDGEIVYEVIRIINKKPLFLKEHFQRLKNSLKYFDIKHIDFDILEESLNKLIESEDITNNNIRMEFGNIKEDSYDFIMYMVESYYPEEGVYDEGVKTITIDRERKIPEIKIENKRYKKDIKKILFEQKAFEAILKTSDGKLLEGSRSNLFFVKGQKLYTAKDQDVLGGITKRKILELIETNGFEIIKKDIYLKELETFEGAFLTGTSIDILPIAQIDDVIFESSSNNLIQELMEKYLKLKLNNIKEC